MSTLLEITQDAQALQALIGEAAEANGGDITEYGPIIEQWQAESDMSLARKLEAYGSLIDDDEAQLAGLELQKEKIADKIKRHEVRKDALESWAKSCLLFAGIKKTQAGSYMFSLAKCPAKLIVDAPIESLPDQWVKKTIEPKLNEIKNAMKLGDVDAIRIAHFAEPELRLSIK